MRNVHFENRSYSNSVTIAIHVAAGAHTEPRGAAGVSHALEHLIFRSTGTSLEDACEAVGGYANAVTGTFATEFWVRVPVGCEDWAFERLMDAVTAPRFEQSLVSAELDVLEREANLHTDDPFARIVELLLAPYGIKTTVFSPGITAEKVARYHRDWYTEATISVAVVGRLERSLLAQAEHQRLPSGRRPRAQGLPLPLASTQDRYCESTHVDDVFGIARYFPQLVGLDAHALEVIERALFGRGSGIISRSVQQRFRVYEVASHLDQQALGSTWYLLSTTATGQARDAVAFIEEELDRFASSGIDADLFARTLTKYRGGMLLERENPLHYARRLAREAKRLEPAPLDELTLDRVNEVLVRCSATPVSRAILRGKP